MSADRRLGCGLHHDAEDAILVSDAVVDGERDREPVLEYADPADRLGANQVEHSWVAIV